MLKPTLGAALAFTALAITATAPAAPSAAGRWRGKYQIDVAKLAASMQKRLSNPRTRPGAKRELDAVKQKMESADIWLTLSRDKTYSITVLRVPRDSGPTATAVGTWSQSGNVLTIRPKKPNTVLPPMTLSGDGKTLTSKGKSTGTIIFHRA